MPSTQSKLIRIIVLAGLTFLYHSHWAHAIPATWGHLPTNSGQDIYDWEVQNWINEFFEDGSRNNGTVNSNIAMYYTQCYGGDWLENFNNILREPVGLYDSVAFSDATVHSANEAGELSAYGGYHDDAALTLQPFNNTTMNDPIEPIFGVHERGVLGKDASETPLAQGRNKEIIPGGIGNVHVLVYAGVPSPLNPLDQADIDNIFNDFSVLPDQATITIVAGDGTGDHADFAATKANLRQAIVDIGAMMDDTVREQFVFFVTDHGGLTQTEVDLTIPALDLTELLVIGLDDFFPHPPLPDPPPDLATISLAISDTINKSLFEVTLTSGGQEYVSIALDDPSVQFGSIQIPDPAVPNAFTTATNYDISVDGSLLFDLLSSQNPVEINLTNMSNQSIAVDFASVGIAVQRVPEPTTFVLLAIAFLALAAPKCSAFR